MRWRHVMPFSHCPISRSAFGHHRLHRSLPSPLTPLANARQTRLPSLLAGICDFRARLREFKRGEAAPNRAGRAAGNGVNGSFILSRSSSAECLMDVFSLRGGLHGSRSLSLLFSLSASYTAATIKTKTLKCIEKVSAAASQPARPTQMRFSRSAHRIF